MVRSALASMNHAETSLPWAAAIASPASLNACQTVAWHTALSPEPQNFVRYGAFSGSPTMALRSLSTIQMRPSWKPVAGLLTRPTSALKNDNCGPSAGARRASASRG